MTTTTHPPRTARNRAPGTSTSASAGTSTRTPTGTSAARSTTTKPASGPASRPATRPAGKGSAAATRSAVRVTPAAPPRAPFVLLVLGLLGGALVSLLLLNTVLAEDAFTLTKLQRSNKLLNEQRQALQEEIAREESPTVLAQKARALGMVQPTRPAFVDARTGRVVGPRVRPVPHAAAAAAGAGGVVAVPGAVVPGDGVPGWREPTRSAGSSRVDTAATPNPSEGGAR
jgi:hypothetical protein